MLREQYSLIEGWNIFYFIYRPEVDFTIEVLGNKFMNYFL